MRLRWNRQAVLKSKNKWWKMVWMWGNKQKNTFQSPRNLNVSLALSLLRVNLRNSRKGRDRKALWGEKNISSKKKEKNNDRLSQQNTEMKTEINAECWRWQSQNKPIKSEKRDLFTAKPIRPIMLNLLTLASDCQLSSLAFSVNTHQK